MKTEVFEIKLGIDRDDDKFRVDFSDIQLDYTDYIELVYSEKDLYDPDTMDGYARFLVEEAVNELISFKQAYREGMEKINGTKEAVLAVED